MREKDLHAIARQVQERLAYMMDSQRLYTDEDFQEAIETCVVKEMENTYLTQDEQRQVVDSVLNTTRKFDFLQPYLDDETVTEIMINGVKDIFVERNGSIQRVVVEDLTEDKLYEIIQNMVSKANRTVNESSPIVDISLPDGSRANIVLKPLAVNGPCVTIRKFPHEPLTMEALVQNGTITRELSAFLKEMVQAKNNVLVSGGTSSGKTTMLNVLSQCIPSTERIVTIEDSVELQLRQANNLVTLEVRNKNHEGAGEISIRDLVKTSMRMRPDRILVGEVRDSAALDMIQALNTGHDGSMSTIHANSAEDALLRLETMALSAAVIPLEAIRRQIATAIHIVIHMERDAQLHRVVRNVIAIQGIENGNYRIRELYHR